MLLAEADPVIQLSIASAVAIGSAIGGGIVAASKILVSYLRSRDAEIVAEIQESRKTSIESVGMLLDIQEKSLTATGGLTIALTKLADRMDRSPEHKPRPVAS